MFTWQQDPSGPRSGLSDGCGAAYGYHDGNGIECLRNGYGGGFSNGSGRGCGYGIAALGTGYGNGTRVAR